jgi:hypothetical protein
VSLGPQMPVTYREQVRGCLLGGALGDALGAGIELGAAPLQGANNELTVSS